MANDKSKPGADTQELTVVVNGAPHSIRANENQEISVIIEQALKDAEQTGRNADDWELRAGEGESSQILEPSKKLRDYGIALPATLFLSLRTGGGGGK